MSSATTNNWIAALVQHHTTDDKPVAAAELPDRSLAVKCNTDLH